MSRTASNRLGITGITVSVDLKRSTYGVDRPVEGRFVSLRAELPEGAAQLTLDEAVEESLALHLAVWRSLYAAELASGGITRERYDFRMNKLTARIHDISNSIKEDTTHGE